VYPMAAIDSVRMRLLRTNNMAGDNCHDLRDKLARFIEHPESSKLAAAFQATIMALIIISTLAVILETVPEIAQTNTAVFTCVETTATVLFTVELVLRFVAAESAATFCTNGFNIVDVVAILPGFTLIFGRCTGARCKHSQASNAMISLRMLRLMWLMRILRLAKVARHSRLLSVCIAVLTQVWHSSILVILGLMFALMIATSSLLHLVEYDRCEALGLSCEGFESIPSTCWFAISTLTTVGYGDVIPQTMVGKLIAVVSSICAVMMLALAGALFSYDFSEHFREERQRSLVELELKIGSDRNQDVRELMDLAREVRSSCDALVHGLEEAAQRRRDNRGFAGETSAVGGRRRLSVAARREAEEEVDKEELISEEPMLEEELEEAPPKPVPMVMMPMLRLIEERARIFCHEVQGCVLASSVDSKDDREDFNNFISYDEDNKSEDNDLVQHALESGVLELPTMSSGV